MAKCSRIEMSITLACLFCCTGCSVQKQEDGAVASATTESVNTETMMTDHSLQEIPYTTSKGDEGYIYASDGVLNSDQNHPLILVMTYTTGNAKAVIQGCGWDTLAENEDVMLISPEYDNYATYSETELLKRDVEYAIQNYKIDTSRIYTTGFSNGGAASVAMISRYPDIFAAMSAMGWMVDMQGQDSSYDIPFQVIQGTSEYTQTINGMPAIMDDERNVIHSLFLYNEMISINTVEYYGDVPCGVRIAWIYTIFQRQHTFTSILAAYPVSMASTAVLLSIALFVIKPSEGKYWE